MLIVGAEIGGAGPLDVRIVGDRIETIEAGLTPSPGEAVLDASGGALIPGLHDHHVHTLAWDAARRSVECGPPGVLDEAGLAHALTGGTSRDGWIRGIGYHESVAGDLDRDILDRWVADRPVRVQHRSGSLWIVNGAGLAGLGLDDPAQIASAPAGVERDRGGRATGRLFHLDGWLRDRWRTRAGSEDDGEADPCDWTSLSRDWSSWGVVGITDATPENGPREWSLFAAARARGALDQSVVLMGGDDLPTRDTASHAATRVVRGARKIRLTDPELPDFDDLCRWIRDAHTLSRPVAIHCVTRAELVLATAALEEARPFTGDRIEHAGVAPPELVDAVRRLDLTVVTQPHFVRERGDAYLTDVDERDRPWLYRCRAWNDAGVPLAGGSDAPFGDPDPWVAMVAAVDRRTRAGEVLDGNERLDPEAALALFTGPADAPGSAPRPIAPGAPADLCLLDRAWRRAREHLDSAHVRATFCAGRLVHDRDGAAAPPRSRPSC